LLGDDLFPPFPGEGRGVLGDDGLGAGRGPLGPLFFVGIGASSERTGRAYSPRLAYLERFPRVCDKALPAAVFDAAEVRPSRRTFDAAVAARGDVDSVRVLLCVNVLPAAARELRPVLSEASTLDAARAARGLVILDFTEDSSLA
jgi:hypothetical protein